MSSTEQAVAADRAGIMGRSGTIRGGGAAKREVATLAKSMQRRVRERPEDVKHQLARPRSGRCGDLRETNAMYSPDGTSRSTSMRRSRSGAVKQLSIRGRRDGPPRGLLLAEGRTKSTNTSTSTSTSRSRSGAGNSQYAAAGTAPPWAPSSRGPD